MKREETKSYRAMEKCQRGWLHTYRLLQRKCDIQIFIHELQDFGKRTSEFSKVLKRVNKNPYKALSML